MIKRKTGFTLMELIIVMAILGLVLAASSDMFIGMLRTYKQQGKIAETNIEGIIGLELFRQDIERAGYGLPWVMNGVTYNEASSAGYNDSPEPPRPIKSAHTYGFNNSDLLVVKAANIVRNDTAQKWTYLATGLTKTWDVSSENFLDPTNQYVIVLSPGIMDADRRTLVLNGLSAWYTKFSDIPGSSFVPGVQDPQPRYVYGIVSNTAPRMPFNRADYYISVPNDLPQRCASNTGVLFKSMINHVNGERSDYLPLLDCVADMKVTYRIDINGDGNLTSTDDISTLSAQQIRTQVKEVRVYILAHQGQKDTNYVHSPSTIAVGEPGLQHNFDIRPYVNFRWKVYTLVVEPKNMRQ